MKHAIGASKQTSASLHSAERLGAYRTCVGGIDAHKTVFNVCYRTAKFKPSTGMYEVERQHAKYQRTPAGLTQAIVDAKTLNVHALAIESTSVYHLFIVKGFQQANIPIIVVNAGQLSQKRRNEPKHDKLSAKKLAEYLYEGKIAETGEVKPSYLPANPIEEALREATRARDRLIQGRTRLKNRIHKIFDRHAISLKEYVGEAPFTAKGLLSLQATVDGATYAQLHDRIENDVTIHGLTRRSIKQCEDGLARLLNRAQNELTPTDRITLQVYLQEIRGLNKGIERLEEEIEILTPQLPETFKRYLEIARSIPGFGETTAIRAVVEYGDIKRLRNRRKAAKYTGLDPRINSSGNTTTIGRITKSGSKNLRKVLFQCAQGAIQHDETFRRYYYYLKNVRKLKYRQIMCAIGRKLGVLYYSLAKHDQLYSERKYKIKIPRTYNKRRN